VGMVADTRVGGRMVKPKSPPSRQSAAQVAPAPQWPSLPTPTLVVRPSSVTSRLSSYGSLESGTILAPINNLTATVAAAVEEELEEEGWIRVGKKGRAEKRK
jgi:hypothetical protein